jgi:L-lysine 2,3-aminomutase
MTNEELENVIDLEDFNRDKMKDDVHHLQQENKELKERIDKAIEYIKTHSEMTDLQICGIENVLAFRGNLEKLLEILGDEE